MVTFFRASTSPMRVTRAARAPRRRQPKKTNDLPHPNKLPGIFGKSTGAAPSTEDRSGPCQKHEALRLLP